MNDKPLCMDCKHRMVVKFAVVGQAQVNKNGQIHVLGPTRQEVINSACKLAMIPICENPCVLDCSEFEPMLVEPKLRKESLVADSVPAPALHAVNGPGTQ